MASQLAVAARRRTDVKRWTLGFLAALLVSLAAVAYAATGSAPTIYVPGQISTSPVVVCGSFPYNGGPQASGVNACGGTFTCTSSGTITVTNANVDANSVFLFGTKTAASPAAFTVSAVTIGTSFAVTCGSGDTSVYNYIILG
jgi:hypothetical protein